MDSQVTDKDVQRLSSHMSDMTMSLEEFSIPYISMLGSQSLLEKSQYGKVIFHDIQDSYPRDGDVLCRYTLTEGVCYAHGDRINIYKVGWRQAEDFLHGVSAPQPSAPGQTELQVLFKASSLPKDDQIYQFCYMTASDEMRGASGPFQFHQPDDDDLCTEEEQDGLVIVSSRMSILEEKIKEAQQTSLTLQREKSDVEVQLQEFTKMLALKNKENDDALVQLSAVSAEKEVLAKRLDECVHLERHMERLQKELQDLDAEKMELQTKLHKAEAQIQALTASLHSLTTDKENISQQLHEATMNASELGQLRGKMEDQQCMINVLTSSKEMITKELRLEINANEKHQILVRKLTDEKKHLEEKITDLEKRLSDSDRLIMEALQREQASIAQLENLKVEKNSLQGLLEQLAKHSQQAVKLKQEIEQLKVEKQALQLALNELQQIVQKEKLKHAQEIKCMKELHEQLAKDGQLEIEQLKTDKQALQLEKVEHAKETKSLTALLEQLAKDSQRELNLAQEIEQLKVENEARRAALDELEKKSSEAEKEYESKIQDMSNKHDSMLAELIRLTGKDKASEQQLAELSDKLREAKEELRSLQELKAKSEDIRCLSDVLLSRATLQRRVDQLEAEEKLSNNRLVVLQDRIELLQRETIRLQSLVDANNGPSKNNCFAELFSCVEQQKMALETRVKDTSECEQEQLERQKTISSRLEELTVEIEAVQAEREDVQRTYLASSADLGRLRRRLQAVDGQTSGFSAEVDDWATVASPLELSELRDEVQNAECFVESSHMRIMQLEQRQQELQQEKDVLDAQQQLAAERVHALADERRSLHRQLAAAHESERSLLREHLDVISSPAGAEGGVDRERDAVLSKLEDTSAISQHGADNAKEMGLRLKLAAAEYRKLYAEKQKAERRLRKLYQRLGDKQGSEVPTAQLVNISSASESSSGQQIDGPTSFSFICPLCSSEFPRGDCEVFIEHFDNHLS